MPCGAATECGGLRSLRSLEDDGERRTAAYGGAIFGKNWVKMGSKQNILGENTQISVEMVDFALTKRSGRLKVNIGAVLRTRINTGDCLSRRGRWSRLRGMGLWDIQGAHAQLNLFE
jgi:hypothetical protein